MIHTFTAMDHPEANGRQPLPGEQGWTLTVPLENGDDYLEIRVGRKGREAFKRMILQEERDLKEEMAKDDSRATVKE